MDGVDTDELKYTFMGLKPVAQCPKKDRIIINVGGVRHETSKHTLNRVPNSRLASCLEVDSPVITAALPAGVSELAPQIEQPETTVEVTQQRKADASSDADVTAEEVDKKRATDDIITMSRSSGYSSTSPEVSSKIVENTKQTEEIEGQEVVLVQNSLSDLRILQPEEFFFDRHPVLFTFILNFYRTGKLHIPNDMCGPLFQEELEFWGIDEKMIEPCCWSNYVQHRHAQKIVRQFEHKDQSMLNYIKYGGGKLRSESEIEDSDQCDYCQTQELTRVSWRTWAWLLLDQPQFSLAAKIYGVFSICMVLCSIAVYSASTTETVQDNDDLDHILFVIDLIINIFFTVEILLKFITCPSKQMFFSDAYVLIDILAIVPVYPQLLFRGYFDRRAQSKHRNSAIQTLLEISRIPRIMRIFKLARHLTGLKILLHTIKSSVKELLLLFFFLCICVVIFSTAIYYTEYSSEALGRKFDSIPTCFWWAFVTMTTLGYGDMVPATDVGRIIGAMCAIFGVLTIALPVPVIVNNFAMYYSYAQARKKLDRNNIFTSGSKSPFPSSALQKCTCAAALRKNNKTKSTNNSSPTEREQETTASGDANVKDQLKTVDSTATPVESGVFCKRSTAFLRSRGWITSSSLAEGSLASGDGTTTKTDNSKASIQTEMTSIDSLDAAIQELDANVDHDVTVGSPGGFDEALQQETPPSSQTPSRSLQTQEDKNDAFKNRGLTPVD